jgi:DNA-directed RNA polymerase specialized sigma24 family protein
MPSAGPAAAAPADDELIRQAYQPHAVGLVWVAVLLLGDQPSAEDVVQEAFFGLYRALPRLRDRAKVQPYLRAAVVNGCRSVLRSRKCAALRGVPQQTRGWSAESAAMAGEERHPRWRARSGTRDGGRGAAPAMAAVARLPRRAREVLALRYHLDLSDREIAAAHGISRGTVSSPR